MSSGPSSEGKRLLVVGASFEQVPLIRRARQGGHFVLVLDRDVEAPGMKLADKALQQSTRDIDGAIRAARRERVEGVATNASESAVLTVSRVAEALSLPGLPSKAAQHCSDKSIMKRCFLKTGVPTADFRLADDVDEAEQAARELGFPCIVKPCDGAGSRGVLRIDAPEQVASAFSRSISFSNLKSCLVESYLDGIELSGDTLSVRGEVHVLGIADKSKEEGGQAGRNVAMKIVYPPRLPAHETAEAEELVRRATESVGIVSGASHVELMRLRQGGFKVLEIGARGGGFYTFSKVMPALSGVDTMQALIDLALGRPFDVSVKMSHAAVLRFVGSCRAEGILTGLSGLEEVRSLTGVLEAGWLKSLGDPVQPVEKDGDRIAYVITVAESRQKALEISDRCKTLLRFSIDGLESVAG